MGKIMLGGVEYTSTYNENKVEQIATDATTAATLPILLAKTGSSETVTEEVRKDPTLTYSPVGNNINFETAAGQNISPHLFLTTKANSGAGAQGDEECVVLQKNVDSNNSTTIYMYNGANSRGLTVQNKVSGNMTSKKLLTVNNSNQISSDCIVGEAFIPTDISASITGSQYTSLSYITFYKLGGLHTLTCLVKPSATTKAVATVSTYLPSKLTFGTLSINGAPGSGIGSVMYCYINTNGAIVTDANLTSSYTYILSLQYA